MGVLQQDASPPPGSTQEYSIVGPRLQKKSARAEAAMPFNVRIHVVRFTAMLEIVQDILDAERKAEETLKKAREEADTIRGNTERKVSQITADTREEAHRQSIEKIEQARRRSSEDMEQALGKEREENDAFMGEHTAEIEALVSEIVDLIVRTDRPD